MESGVVSCTFSSPSCWLRRWISQDGTLAGLLGFQHGRADGAAPGEFRRHEQVALAQRERFAQGAGDAGILRDCADQRHRRLHRAPLDDGAFVIARHRRRTGRAGSRPANSLSAGRGSYRSWRTPSSGRRCGRRNWRCSTSCPRLRRSTACAAPADRGTIRCRRRIRRSGHNPGWWGLRGGCTWSFRRRFRRPCALADRTRAIMRAMALNSFSKNRPSTLAMVRLPEPVTRMPSTRCSGTTS